MTSRSDRLRDARLARIPTPKYAVSTQMAQFSGGTRSLDRSTLLTAAAMIQAKRPYSSTETALPIRR